MRVRASAVALLLFLSACSDGGAELSVTTTSTSPSVPSSETTVTTTGVTTTVVAPNEAPGTTRPAPNPDRQPAPDFALTLSDGSRYELANETGPVYTVFWAEW